MKPFDFARVSARLKPCPPEEWCYSAVDAGGKDNAEAQRALRFAEIVVLGHGGARGFGF
jgi:hypothetical protein